MARLNKSLLQGNFQFPDDVVVSKFPNSLPERVIQFGEGNFLRAFVDWMIHQTNKQGLFNGRVVAAQPIGQGLAETINAQDGLYTLLLRGLRDGVAVEEKEVMTSVSRCLNPYTQWQEYLRCAENPQIEFVISNTTEAGIVFVEEEYSDEQCPTSFPAKLTVYLYHRFKHFQADPEKGLVIMPCELIDRNGDNLKRIVLQYVACWNLPQTFADWLETSNYFLNTLVDRVVTGYPKDEIGNIQNHLGYQDSLVDTAELFHLWVIEGPLEVSERFPLHKAGFNVIWTNDMTPYRTRKVRILNGAHTASVPAAFLYGLDTVGEMMDHDAMGKYVREIIYDEIVPSIDLDKIMLTEFADAVVERFRNPYIKHYLLSILLNSSSKFKARVLPSILAYQRLYGKLPEKLTFSLAALVAVYKDGTIDASGLHAVRNGEKFVMKDDQWVLEFFSQSWSEFDGSKHSVQAIAAKVLANTKLWGQDLTFIPGLVEQVGNSLQQITRIGMQNTIADLLKGKAPL